MKLYFLVFLFKCFKVLGVKTRAETSVHDCVKSPLIFGYISQTVAGIFFWFVVYVQIERRLVFLA